MNDKASISRAFPATPPSDAIRVRVAEMAERATRRGRWQRVPVLALSAAAVIVLGFILTPRAAKANTLFRVQSAFDNVRAFRVVTYLVDDTGKLTVSSVLDSVGGNTREKRGNRIDFRTGSEYIVYKPDERLAVKSTVVRNGRPIDDVRGMLMQLRRSNWVKNIKVDEKAMHNGRPVIELSFEFTSEPSRLRMFADKTTLLPLRGELDWRMPDGGWRLERVYDVTYDETVAASSVEPKFTADTRVIDNDQLKEEWSKRLEQGLATVGKGGARVVIRDVVELSSGDVMVLYTNGRRHIAYRDLGVPHKASDTPPMPALDSVHDAAGHAYIFVDGLQGTMYTTQDQFIRGFVFNGEDLQAGWFTPLEESRVQGDLTLHFTGDGVSFNKKVGARLGGATPDWADLVGMAPRDPMEVVADAAGARGHHYLGKDDQKAADELAKCIRHNDMRMAAIGERILQGGTYADLGSALHRLGRDSEARIALEHAIRDDPSGRANYELQLEQLGKPYR